MLEKILRMIESEGMNEKQFTETVGLHNNVFSKWKKGTSIPKLDVLIKIADYFQISLDELVGRNVPERKPTALETVTEKLTPVQIEKLVIYAQGMLDG